MSTPLSVAHSVINYLRPQVPAVIVDFGWYFGITPRRWSEDSFNVDGSHYPPGMTVLDGAVTLPSSTITVASTASFEANGLIVLDSGSAHQSVRYTGLTGTTFTGCTGGTGTFVSATPVYDPRFYVDRMPLQMEITFDAQDAQDLGLPVTTVPPGVSVHEYRWDFGNGQTGFGTSATTTYDYNLAPPSIQATLTVIDSLGRETACAHPLNLQDLTSIYGSAIWERVGSARS